MRSLSVATEDRRDVDVLKRKALEALALSYYAVPSDTFTSDAIGCRPRIGGNREVALSPA